MKYKEYIAGTGLFFLVASAAFFSVRFFDGHPTAYWAYMLHHPSDVIIDETLGRLVDGRAQAVPVLLDLLQDKSDSYLRVTAACAYAVSDRTPGRRSPP